MEDITLYKKEIRSNIITTPPENIHTLKAKSPDQDISHSQNHMMIVTDQRITPTQNKKSIIYTIQKLIISNYKKSQKQALHALPS